jgi:hypothetical protein
VSPAELDPPIRGFVAALNRTDRVRTVFSCAGHPEEPDSVRRGRRQAHVDVLVSDLKWWRTLAQRCGRDAQAAVGRLGVTGRSRIRWAEGSLGPPPDWLLAAIEREAPAAGGTESTQLRAQRAPGSVLRRLLALLDVTGRRRAEEQPTHAQPVQWRYRRLVLEPVPYAMPSDVCRQVLDAALGAAECAVRRFEAEMEA